MVFTAAVAACDRAPVDPQLEDRVTLTLEAPVAGSTLYGRVAAFSGKVSNASVSIRYSVNGEPERIGQMYPPHSGSGTSEGNFRGEAQPLRNGANTVVLRAYLGDTAVGTRSFDVMVDVPERRYAVTLVAEVPSGATMQRGAYLANDGRLAWSYPGAAFTWHDGTLVPLTGMGGVYALNNVGQVLGIEAGGSTSVLWKAGAYTRLTDFPDATMLNDHGHLARSLMPGYWHNGQFTAYPQPGMVVEMTAMNNHGAMVGNVPPTRSVAAWLTPPQFQHLPGPPLTIRAWAGTIGDGGHVLVRGRTSSTVPEFVLRQIVFHAGSVSDLSATVGLVAAAANVNASGVVAGTYGRGDALVPYTWKDGRTTDVALDSPDWNIEAVTDINDVGQIAARGRHVTTGQVAILLLTPLG